MSRIIFRLIGLLIVIGLVAGGGMMAYRAGFEQGVAQSPAIAAAIAKSAPSGQVVPVPPMYGYGYGASYGYGYPMYGHPHFGFFPLGGICFSIIILFFFLGMLKMMFFRRMAWSHDGGHHGPPWMRHHHHGWEEKKEGDQKDEAPAEKK